jgi:hypothetical protein
MDSLRHNRIAVLIREKVAATGWENAGNAFSAWRERNARNHEDNYNRSLNAFQTWRENNTATRQRGDDRMGNAVASWFAPNSPPGRAGAKARAVPPVAPQSAPAQSVAQQAPAAGRTFSDSNRGGFHSSDERNRVLNAGVQQWQREQAAPASRPAAPASPAAPAQAPTVSPKTGPGAGATPGIAAVTGKAPAQPFSPVAAPAAGGEKKQFTSYWQMAKAMNEGVTDPSKRMSAAELSKKFDGRMIQKGDTFDLNAIRGGTYAGASGAKGSFDKWQAARAQKAAPASSPMQSATPTAPARQTPPPATVADTAAGPSRVTGARRITTPGGGTLPPGSTGVLGTPPPMRPAFAVRSPSEQARTAAAVAFARQQVRQGSTAPSDTIANSALSATKPLVPRPQTQLGSQPGPRT